MPSKPGAAFVVFALLALGAGAFWQYRRAGHAPAAGQAAPPAEAPGPSAPAMSLEAAMRQLMPGAGLFRGDWLRLDQGKWNLKIPRRRDARAAGEYFKAGLEKAGVKITLFEWRDYPQWRGFYLEAGGEALTAVQDRNPGLALVIDDWGYHTKQLKAMQDFPTRLTIAVLPGLAHSAECAEAAFEVGHEVILHLPMEPEHSMPMLEGTLVKGMPAQEVRAWLDRHASTVPHMTGLNNHEGSKGSADRDLMREVAAWLAGRGLYFLDSKTSAASVGEFEAKRAGVPRAARRVFLDNVDEPGAIEKALREAIAIAQKTGACVAIGHPRRNTMEVLTRMAPEIVDMNIDLVRASELTLYEIPHAQP